VEHSSSPNLEEPDANWKIQKSWKIDQIQACGHDRRRNFDHQGKIFDNIQASESLKINYSTAKSILQNLKKQGSGKESTSPSC
jgi:hypothetical protein